MTTRVSGFRLLPFQEEAADSLREAALKWVSHASMTGKPRYGASPIPFVGQLRAVTGSGKTPILADVVGGLGDAVVLWTTKSAVVVEQTYQNLRGRYRSLLPDDCRVMREIPSQAEWQDLLTSKTGLTIWVLTTASWNEAEAARRGGDSDARLRLHQPAPDWSGPDSPWDLLRSRLVRPLWIVSDESHNQSSVQLDILAGLNPVGFFMASATHVPNDLFDAWQKALGTDPTWKELAEASVVKVRTRDVVAAELLKTTIELYDNNSGYEEDLDSVLAAMKALDTAIAEEGAPIQPRAIHVVEKSNPTRGSQEQARPTLIWRYLVGRGVSKEAIAVYTDTKELPEGAERISSLSQLQPRHRHIIFNQALQEGWDDPEAYVCYFDGTTRSFVRIRQIVGRILRQPRARHFETDRLNTATIFINTPTDDFEKVLSELQAELRLYAPEDEPSAVPVRVRTKRNPLPSVPPRSEFAGLELPRWSLDAPDMTPQVVKIRSRGASPWGQEFLDAPGQGLLSVISLDNEGVERTELLSVLRSARSRNCDYFRRRLLARNRAASNAIHPDALKGPGFEQFSCQGSVAQQELSELASQVAAYYEDRVRYEEDPDPDRSTWRVSEYRPRNGETVAFCHSVHESYSRGDFNADELLFAQALDSDRRGVWMRNPSTSDQGFSIPLPIKVGDSTRFFPDFLWWVEERCWAIDTTGKHLLSDKVRGKLVGLPTPHVALIVRGKVDLERGVTTDRDGWTTVIARPALTPIVEHSDDLSRVLEVIVTF